METLNGIWRSEDSTLLVRLSDVRVEEPEEFIWCKLSAMMHVIKGDVFALRHRFVRTSSAHDESLHSYLLPVLPKWKTAILVTDMCICRPFLWEMKGVTMAMAVKKSWYMGVR